MRRSIQFDDDKALRLRCLYLGNVNMNGLELNKDYPTLNFERDEDVRKMSLFCFIELAMMGRRRRQHMDWTMLDLIDDLEDFVSYDWG